MKKEKFLVASLSISGVLLLSSFLNQTNAQTISNIGVLLSQGNMPDTTAIPPTSPTEITPETIAAPSETGVDTSALKGDYTILQANLQQQNWGLADQATLEVMLKVAGPSSEEQGRFDLAEWKNFSCPDLKEIDRLWSEASDGKLGFAAQKRVFERARRNYYVFYSQIEWFDVLTNLWKVAWEYDPVRKQTNYRQGMLPNFEAPQQIEGHLPAKLEWMAPDGETPQDRRLERIYACPEFQ